MKEQNKINKAYKTNVMQIPRGFFSSSFVLLLEFFELKVLIKRINESSKPVERWPQPPATVFAGTRGLNFSCFSD